MTLEQIIGNTRVKGALEAMASSGRIPHAMMLYENDGCGALALVSAFLELINGGGRPDVHYTFPVTGGTKVSGAVKDLTCNMFAKLWKELMDENPYFLESDLSAALGFERKSGVIAVAEGKSILQKLSLSSVSGGWRAVVIWLPEKMNQQTANMLLKAIEEPAEGDIFILITHSPESVLQTISSRCQMMRVLPLSKEEVAEVLTSRFGVDEAEASHAAAFAGGSVGLALHLLAEESGTMEVKELSDDLLERVAARDFSGALEAGERASALDSREKQKAFCSFAAEGVRKIYMVQQGQDALSGILPAETDFYRQLAGKLGKAFPRRASAAIDRASAMIERNVNQKIVFCCLASRLFASV